MAHTRMIRLKEVKRRIGLSRSSIYALVKQGSFPRQIQLGPRSVAWLESDIDDWIERRVSNRKPPTC